jgi:hypothetical protein
MLRLFWIVFSLIFFMESCTNYEPYTFRSGSTKQVSIIHLYEKIQNPWDQTIYALGENAQGVYLITQKNYDSKEFKLVNGNPVYPYHPTYDIFGLTTRFEKNDLSEDALKEWMKSTGFKKVSCAGKWCRFPRHDLYARIVYPSENKKGIYTDINVYKDEKAKIAYERNAAMLEERRKKEREDMLRAKAEEYIEKILRRYGLPASVVRWKGAVDERGVPYGNGTLSFSEEIGQTLTSPIILSVSVDTDVDKGAFSSGRVRMEVYEVSGIPSYRSSRRFDSVGELKRIIQDAKREYWSKKRRQQERLASMYKEREGTYDCDEYKAKCLKYCGAKSPEASGFATDDRTACRQQCNYGHYECLKGNEFGWKNFTCSGICKGVEEGDAGFLPFSKSSFDRCVADCKDRFFK